MTAQLTVPTANDSQTAQKIAGPYQRAALSVERALSMDDNALARIRPSVTEGAVDIFVTTPLHSVLVQRVPGTISFETVVAARDLPAKLREITGEAAAEESIQLTGGMDFMWTGALPPHEGFTVVDFVPAGEIRSAHAAMGKENADAAAPGGVARSLLEQDVVTLASEKEQVALTGRHIAALGGLGIAAKPGDPRMEEYDLVRVSVTGSWIRIDALFGTIYSPRPGGLARVPQPS